MKNMQTGSMSYFAALKSIGCLMWVALKMHKKKEKKEGSFLEL